MMVWYGCVDSSRNCLQMIGTKKQIFVSSTKWRTGKLTVERLYSVSFGQRSRQSNQPSSVLVHSHLPEQQSHIWMEQGAEMGAAPSNDEVAAWTMNLHLSMHRVSRAHRRSNKCLHKTHALFSSLMSIHHTNQGDRYRNVKTNLRLHYGYPAGRGREKKHKRTRWSTLKH